MGKDLEIARMSSMKTTIDICSLLEYKPKSLTEFFRISEMVTLFVIDGLSDDVKKDIKKFDEVLKKKP